MEIAIFVAGVVVGYFCRPTIDKAAAKFTPKDGGGPGEEKK